MSINTTITVRNAKTGQQEAVAELDLWNDGTGTPERGNYRYKLRINGELREGALRNFRRSHPHGAVRLVAEVLRQAVPFEPELLFPATPRGRGGGE